MAQNMVDAAADFQFVNSQRATATAGGNSTGLSAGGSNYLSVSALRSALAAYDAFTYTATALDAMSVNDMVFALRNCSDPKTIADYMVAQTARVS